MNGETTATGTRRRFSPIQLLGTALLCVGVTMSANAETVSVTDGSSIQEALTASAPGSTILVYPGTYEENIVIDKSVALRSVDGASNTIIAGQNSDAHVIHVTAPDVVVDGFSVYGATSTDRAGIYLDEGADRGVVRNNRVGLDPDRANWDGISLFSVSGCVVNNNQTDGNASHGIRLQSSDDNNQVTGNRSSGNAYGIYLYMSNRNTVEGNHCTDNINDGVYVLVSDENSIRGNTSTGNVRGLFLRSARKHTVENNVAVNNEYGIVLYECLWDNVVRGNTCSNNTEIGIYLTMGTTAVVLTENLCLNNKTGLSIWGSSHWNEVADNIFEGSVDGIDLYLAENNKIYRNDILGGVLPNDLAEPSNVWFVQQPEEYFYGSQNWVGQLGNYFDDHDLVDSDGDGITDNPYRPGGADSPFVAENALIKSAACFRDIDGDLVADCDDTCPLDNPDDTDADGVCDSNDACEGGNDAADNDGDGVADFCDACPSTPNAVEVDELGCAPSQKPDSSSSGGGSGGCFLSVLLNSLQTIR